MKNYHEKVIFLTKKMKIFILYKNRKKQWWSWKKNFTHRFDFPRYMKIGLRCVSCALCFSFCLYWVFLKRDFFMLKRVAVGEKWKKILEQEWDVEFKKIMIHENLSGYLVIQDIYKP